MKRIFKSSFRFLTGPVALVLPVVLFPCLPLAGQDTQIRKTWKWEYPVTGPSEMVFTNYNCDLIIHTGDRNTIAYNLLVEAGMKSEEDARQLTSYLDDLEFSHSGNRIAIDNRIWRNRRTRGKTTTMELKNGEDVRGSSISLRGELWIPVSCKLQLESKYSLIELEDLDQGGKFNLYSDKFYAGNMDGPVEITDKYSTLEFKEMKSVEADFYSTDFEAGNIGPLTAVSKYSKFKAGNAGTIDIDGYSDKYTFLKTGDIHMVSKYTDLRAESTGILNFDGYSSNAYIESVTGMDVRSKYGKYEIGETGRMNITSTYSDNYNIGSLNTLDITDSKYGNFRITMLSNSLQLKEGYSDVFDIEKTGKAFRGFDMNGKYVKSKVGIDPGLSFRFEANVQYADLDLPEEQLDVKVRNAKDSHLEMKAFKGKETENMPAFFINGYQMSLSLTDIRK